MKKDKAGQRRETRLEPVAVMQGDKAGSQRGSGSEGGDHERGQDCETKKLQRHFFSQSGSPTWPYIEK